jgi:hypothetical protein
MTSSRSSARAALALTLKPNVPNAARTCEALRELGYDSYASILDITDNCIDAGAKEISIQVQEDGDDIVILIDDDGVGMSAETLDEALRLGSDTVRDPSDLGKFGAGLVTASIGLCRRVEVFTKAAGSSLMYGGFDLDEIASRNEFVKWVQEADAYAPADFAVEHGTRVRLTKIDRISNRRPTDFANTLRKRIGQTYRRFLKAGLKILVNGKPAEAFDPLMLADGNTKVVFDEQLEVEGGSSIHLRAVELPDLGPAGNKEFGINQNACGFYVLRNNREIMAAETFEIFKKHPEYAHFRAEISYTGCLDDVFHTDVKKMTIRPSQSFVDRLAQATRGLTTESSREAKRRANVKRGDVDHTVAEKNITSRTTLIPKPRTLVERRGEARNQGTHSKGTGERTRSPHVGDLKTPSGLGVRFEEGDFGDGPFYSVKQEGKTIVIAYNREHPFWRELVEHATDPKVIATLDYVVFAMANAELLVPEQARIVKENVNATLVGLLV